MMNAIVKAVHQITGLKMDNQLELPKFNNSIALYVVPENKKLNERYDLSQQIHFKTNHFNFHHHTLYHCLNDSLNKIKSIGITNKHFFDECYSLNEVVVPYSMTYNLMRIMMLQNELQFDYKIQNEVVYAIRQLLTLREVYFEINLYNSDIVLKITPLESSHQSPNYQAI